MKSLLIENKELMKDFDYNKNQNLDIKNIRSGSNQRVWWKCHKCGHEWQTTVANRAGTLKRGCPKCKKVQASHTHSLTSAMNNNILKLYPHIAAEWHPTKRKINP